jgi:hypothetical protein
MALHAIPLQYVWPARDKQVPLKNAAECLLWTTMLYAAGLAAFADDFAPAEQWLRAMDGVIAPLFFVRESTDQLLLYRHVLLVCLFVTSGWIWIGRRWVPSWAGDVLEIFRQRNPGTHPSRLVWERAHGLSMLGACAVVYLLVFDPTLSRITAVAPRSSVFIVPPLSVSAFLLICRALALRRLASGINR